MSNHKHFYENFFIYSVINFHVCRIDRVILHDVILALKWRISLKM